MVVSFSVSLWLLDENPLYALFTLSLLVFTAFTVVIQRMRTMLTLRQMKLNPCYVTVYRNKQWTKVSSENLVPGDIVMIQTADQAKPIKEAPKQQPQPGQVHLSDDEQAFKDQIPFSDKLPLRLFKTENMNTDSFRNVPCDLLLLNGSVVVNESMLTGESVPQVKDSIDKFAADLLDIKSAHKQSVIFCGTEILQT